jgi:tetratricopeptide (TPR) repeat protein
MRKQISGQFKFILFISFFLLIGCNNKKVNTKKINDTTSISFLMNKGLDYYKKNDFANALNYFKKASKIDSSNLTGILLLKSTSELNLNDPQSALLDMKKAIVHDNGNPQVYLEFAKIFNAIHYADSSYYYANKALELQSKDPNIYLYKSLADYRRNKLRESLIEIDKFIKLNSNNNYKNDAIILKVFLTYITQNKSTIDTLKKYEDVFINVNKSSITDLYNLFMCSQIRSYSKKNSEAYCQKIKGMDSIVVPIFNDDIRLYLK